MTNGTWDCKQEAGALLDWIHQYIVATKGVVAVPRPTVDSLEIQSQQVPVWAVLLAIFLFPIGLLFLAAKDRMVLYVRVSPRPEGGSTLTLSGRAAPGVLRGMKHVYEQTAVSDPAATVEP